MSSLFVANIEVSKTEGIFKKIYAQAQSISIIENKCKLICKINKKTTIIEFNKGEEISEKTNDKSILDNLIDICKLKKIKLVYIRHMIPSIKLIKILKYLQKNDINVFYEIPTYPYYAEQIRSSNNKIRTFVRLTIDTIFWPLIYRYIYKLVVIRSNSKAKKYKKMIEITNGVSLENIDSKVYDWNNNKNDINLVAVGTIYRYHGYDLLIDGLHEYYKGNYKYNVYLHIVGESDEIENLKKKVNDFKLRQYINFYGRKTTEELNDLYKNFDIGVGCLALYRRNADIDTTLKVIEYYCRGVPIITSGKSPLCIDKEEIAAIKVKNNGEIININNIIDQYKKISKEQIIKLSEVSRKKFSWLEIMKGVIVNNDE